ncbi:hypothetical protein RB195_003804 [Necator americanus]|uniref:Secreted protein n=1 Tax=Necator americanus TaxID=51031 RepID=A0ABR1DSY5_NECAM
MDTLFCWFAPIIIVVLSSFSEQIVSFNESVREDRGGWAELCSSTTPSGKIREITAGDNINPAINSEKVVGLRRHACSNRLVAIQISTVQSV